MAVPGRTSARPGGPAESATKVELTNSSQNAAISVSGGNSKLQGKLLGRDLAKILQNPGGCG
jgi:hypothetical protein